MRGNLRAPILTATILAAVLVVALGCGRRPLGSAPPSSVDADGEYRLEEGGSLRLERDGTAIDVRVVNQHLLSNGRDAGPYHGEPFWILHDGTVLLAGTTEPSSP